MRGCRGEMLVFFRHTRYRPTFLKSNGIYIPPDKYRIPVITHRIPRTAYSEVPQISSLQVSTFTYTVDQVPAYDPR